jgi:lipopolysaccharide/colanic/teichoic acid biosynthesis glycosyltransferase
MDSVYRKVEYDLSYIQGWNLLKDLKILCITIVVVITGRGAC